MYYSAQLQLNFKLLAMVRGASTRRDLKNLYQVHLILDPIAFGTQSDFRLHPSLKFVPNDLLCHNGFMSNFPTASSVICENN